MKGVLAVAGWVIWALMLLGVFALPIFQGNFWYLSIPLFFACLGAVTLLVRRALAKKPRPRTFDGTEEEAVGRLLKAGRNADCVIPKAPGQARWVEGVDESRWFVDLPCALVLSGRKVSVDCDHRIDSSMREVTNPREVGKVRGIAAVAGVNLDALLGGNQP